MKAVSLLSGGMDSTTLLCYLKSLGYTVTALSINYNQRHQIELEHAAAIAREESVKHVVVNLPDLQKVMTGSALTDDVAVPHGHYADETMKITVVPNRNMILLSIAGALAVAEQADVIAFAAHAGDHAIYPDCRPEFANAFEHALHLATEGYGREGLTLVTPFILKTKADIATIGYALNVPFNLTWSCYEGGSVHCGQCGTCVERKEAFRLAGVPDPTTYEVA